MNDTSFAELNLIEPICRSLIAENYTHPTPIQAQSIPQLLEGGDLLGCAQTGTGKTAAFTLPMLQRLSLANRRPERKGARALILTPTRELAIQIGECVRRYGRHLKLRHTVVYGGVGYGGQIGAMQNGVDILIATPGRLIDLLGQGYVKLGGVEILVLDEADRMLDMGFLKDVKRILEKLPKERQTLLFSATMPKEISGLAESILRNPKRVEVAPVSSTAERIDQQVLFVDRENKKALLVDMLQNTEADRVLVFTRTKHGANRLAKQLSQAGHRSEAIHGNKSQGARQKALEQFRRGQVKVLVATDIVARGIDVDGISHVVNFEISNEPESYVHRIGRTARGGESGVAYSFCDMEERPYLRNIERLLGKSLAILEDHPYHAPQIASAMLRGGGGGGNSRNNSGRRRRFRGRGERTHGRSNPQFA